MMRRDKYILTTIALTAIVLSGVAAEVEKEVEVTRAYIPEIKEAVKLHLTPDSSDDSYITPDIDYSITPVSIETKYESELYRPIQVNLEEFQVSKRYYTKLGVGAPLQSVVDIYATPIKSRQGYLMGYFNQDGRFAKIENDFAQKQSASQNHMRGGVAVGQLISTRMLEGAVTYNNDSWSRCAMSDSDDAHPLYQSLDLGGRFGDNFTDLTHLNFAVELSMDYFWSRYGYSSLSYDGGALLARELFAGEVEVGLNYSAIHGSDNYDSRTYNAKLSYRYDGSYWGFKLGANYYNDKVLRSENYITPDAEISYHVSRDRVVAYAKSSGGVLHRDFASLSEINPYLREGLYGSKSGVEYDNIIGVKGTIKSGVLGYNLYVGYGVSVDHLYWALYEGVNTNTCEFEASYSNQSNLNFNLDLEYMPTSNLLIGTSLSVSDYYNKKGQAYADGEATTELMINARYSVAKWRFGLDGKLLSSRECSVIYSDGTSQSPQSVKIPTTFDLGLSVDYTLRNSMVIFAQAKNLINDELYEWVGFREYGINAMVGVKMQF